MRLHAFEVGLALEDQTCDKCLYITRSPFALREGSSASLAELGKPFFVHDVCCCLGFLQLASGKYLLVVTAYENVGYVIQGNPILRVQRTSLYPLGNPAVLSDEEVI